MPAPFSPDPTGQPARPPDAKAPSTQNSTDPPHDPEAVTPHVAPAAPLSEPPTVISGNRSRRGPFDPRVGNALAGRKLGHFELIESVGAGGMAAVLKARDLDLGRIVALKILPPDMAADPENVIRFKQEARAAARLDDENIARVYFCGEDQGLHFIAFEFVEGDNLRQLMTANGGSIPVPDAVALILQVSAGLAHAAERGVVHRDIKPSNILVTPDGRAKIVDMGLARNLDPKAVGQLTESGVTLGTFDYISPEQAHDPRSADVRSDIYSLGCTFYHALTGHLPVPEGNAAKKLDAQKNILPPDPRVYVPNIPEDLVAVLGRMMAKHPDRRYQHPDHLAAHLRSVARRLGVPVGPPPAHGPAFEDPLPKPPKLTMGWVLAGAATIALFAVVLTNAFRPGPDVNFPEAKGNVQLPTDNDNGPPGTGPAVAANGSREAANTEELVALLDEGVRHIRLTGQAYDLVGYRYRNGHAAEPVLTGEDVRLEGVNQPTVRIGYVAADGKKREKSLTVRGSGRGTAVVRGIRFVFPDVDGEAGQAGLVVTGFDKATVEECTFAPPPRSSRDGDHSPANGAAAATMILRGGSAGLSQCYFAPGSGGLAIDGPGHVTASECALGTQHAAIRVGRSATDQKGETELTLTHCSALLPAGASVVQVDDSVPCVIKAAFCLFSGPDKSPGNTTVLRQRGERADSTRYEAVDPETTPNGYYGINAYRDDEGSHSFADAAREGLPIKDVERPMKLSPWEDTEPLALLAAKPPEPRKAFKPNLKLADLRVKGDRPGILGARYLGPDPLYTTVPAVESEARDLTVKVWDPSLSETAEDLPPGVFPTLARALAAVRRGDTLLIRYTGRLEVDPTEFTKPNTDLTIKPEPGSKPVLVPSPAGLKRADGLFKLFGKQGGGRLVLDGLQFRLPAGRAPAVAVLPGGGSLEIRNSVITMEDAEDLAVVSLIDPRNEMNMGTAGPESWPVPKVTVENVFVRGKGRLLAVKGSRPFELDVKNALAALDSTLIDIDPSTADPAAAGSGVVRLSRVTAYLAGSLIHFRAAERKAEMGPAGLARTDVTANNCVFAPAGATADPLVRADRVDTKDQLSRWFGWQGKENVYGYNKSKVVLEMRPSDPEAMMQSRIDGDAWLALTLEEGDPFADVGFGYRPPEAGQTRMFLNVRPIDFRQLRLDPPRADGTADLGAPADVPTPFPAE
jgi:hypothetical protein